MHIREVNDPGFDWTWEDAICIGHHDSYSGPEGKADYLLAIMEDSPRYIAQSRKRGIKLCHCGPYSGMHTEVMKCIGCRKISPYPSCMIDLADWSECFKCRQIYWCRDCREPKEYSDVADNFGVCIYCAFKERGNTGKFKIYSEPEKKCKICEKMHNISIAEYALQYGARFKDLYNWAIENNSCKMCIARKSLKDQNRDELIKECKCGEPIMRQESCYWCRDP